MRFTPSATYTQIAASAGKQIAWSVYARIASDLSGSMSGTGGWTDVSSKVTNIPDTRTQIEIEVGQFSSDSAQIDGFDVSYWRTNWFTDANIASTNYIEMKIVASLSQGSLVASDEVIVFGGFVDKTEIDLDELSNKASFSLYSMTDMASRIAAEYLSARYVKPLVDGSHDGLILANISGVYITNANVSSYVLTKGVHTISYTHDGTQDFIALDGGTPIEVTAAGTYTPVNLIGDQKVNVYVAGKLNAAFEDTFVVKTAGDTVPYYWLKNISVASLLSLIFKKMGISTITMDTLEMSTYDSRLELSSLGTPPDDLTVTGISTALASKSDGTLYVAVGSTTSAIYKRDATTLLYSLVCTTSIYARQLLYDSTNDILWIIASGKVALYKFGSSTLVDNVTATGLAIYRSGWFPNSSGVLLFVDGSGNIKNVSNAGTVTTLFTSPLANGATVLDWADRFSATKFYFKVLNVSNKVHSITWGGASWSDDGSGSERSINTNMTMGAINQSETRLYYTYVNGLVPELWASDLPPLSANNAKVTFALTSSDSIDEYFYSSSAVYFLAHNDSVNTNQTGFYYAASSAVTLIKTFPIASAGSSYRTMAASASRLFGVSGDSTVWMYAATVAFYIPILSVAGQSLRDILNEVCNSFGLVYNVNPIKTARVYNRCDSSGVPTTTGNTLTLGTNNGATLGASMPKSKKVGMVTVDNQSASVSYDGSSFGALDFTDVRKVSLSSAYIPTNILKDVAYRIYKFFGQDRTLYTVTTPQSPLFQFEPLDGGAMNFTSTKIQNSGSGVIYSAEYHKDGSLTVEVLI